MAGLLANFRNTVILSVILALVMVGAYTQGPHGTDSSFWQAVLPLRPSTRSNATRESP